VCGASSGFVAHVQGIHRLGSLRLAIEPVPQKQIGEMAEGGQEHMC